MIDTMFSFLKQILKKICDHPLLLTKKAAEGVLEGMDEMLNDQEKGMVQKMAMNLADMTNEDDGLQVGGDVSCKLTFIMSLLVSILECMPIFVVTSVVPPVLIQIINTLCCMSQRNLIVEGHHMLIFSQTRKMLNLIQVCAPPPQPIPILVELHFMVF